jgi:hypothetical protein
MQLKTGAETASETSCFIFKMTMDEAPPPPPQKGGGGQRQDFILNLKEHHNAVYVDHLVKEAISVWSKPYNVDRDVGFTFMPSATDHGHSG